MTLTHASFFSGVGGLDLGLERAGWRTVSFSEIDPYACAVLAHRWPGVPNLGSIVDVAAAVRERHSGVTRASRLQQPAGGRGGRADPDWTRAVLWSGGFPCQDLSVAGKRRGMGTHEDRLDTRSGLAYAFLDLVERYRPPALVLENVPGLLSSHAGRDLGALIGRLHELGYVGSYRVLDARYFGVPQRRRRVFIVALDAGRGATADDAAEVLSVGSRCERHPATGGEAREGAASGAADGPGVVGTVLAREGKGIGHNFPDDHLVQLGPSPDPGGVRAADGLARWLDNSAGVAFVKGKRAQNADDDESWRAGDVAPTLNSFDVGDTRATVAVITPDVAATILSSPDGGTRTTDLNQTWVEGGTPGDDPLLPDGLDSHRYRCCGNGVVAPVAEFVGERLRLVMERLLVDVAA